jgi:CheY-like chemotaxis protein
MLKNLQDIKPRILLVDNDPDVCDSYEALLKEWGYTPILATGRGSSLKEDARKKAEECRCSLALVDLRLIDDDDEEDMSGAEFAKSLKSLLHPIILTGTEDPATLRKLLQDYKEIPYLGKQDRRDEFHTRLDAEAVKVSASRRQIEFIQTELLDEFLKSDLIKGTKEYADQIADILVRLFPDAKTLRFEKVSGWGETEVSSAVRPNSIVLKVYEDGLEPCLVKLARAKKVQHEVNSYYEFIGRKLTGSFSAQLLQKAIAWDIGGAAYTFISGNGTRTFSAYYKDQSIENIKDVLGSFFNGMWGKYYHQATPEKKSLFDLYTEVWGQDWYEKCANEVSVSSLSNEGLNVISQKFGLPNPIEWLNNRIKENELVFDTKTAITHGDLHGDNLMVDDRKNVWVIDFERCGRGHILQDFIELEADVLNRLLGHPANMHTYLKMCMTVFKPTTINSFQDTDVSSEDAEIEKALKTISIIRGIAAQCTNIQDAREHLYGLLFNMIFRAQLLQKTDRPKSAYPLLTAGIICHRLEHWDQSWHPIEWNIIETEKL